MALFTNYSLKLVKESSKLYDCTNSCTTPKEVVEILNTVHELKDQAEEVMILLCLNTKNKVIGSFEVSRGAVDKAIIHPREIFKRALSVNATSIIIAHNHPSGDTTPSQADIRLTERIYECGELLGIKLLDHLIVGEPDSDYSWLDTGFTSLKQEGHL